ncbi:MAG: hypothetical protein LH470_00580 [Lysobacter sp.]|nr:hypothetical protein [Lysobacter sp.]
MKIILLASVVAAFAASPVAHSGSQKYAAPINVTKDTTIQVRVTGSAPSPITETLYRVTVDFDGDDIPYDGILRVACRDKAVAFASFMHVGGGLGSGKRSESNEMLDLMKKPWDANTPIVGRDVTVIATWNTSAGKTMAADTWQTVTIKTTPQLFCP